MTIPTLTNDTAYTITACDQYTWNGQTYTATGTYTYDHSQPGSSCTNVDTLYLTINNSNSGTEVQTVCDTYTWHGITYTATTNTPTYIEQNSAGCDSVVTLNLTINYSSHNSYTQNACDSYTWHGQTYTSTGVYTHDYTNTAFTMTPHTPSPPVTCTPGTGRPIQRQAHTPTTTASPVLPAPMLIPCT